MKNELKMRRIVSKKNRPVKLKRMILKETKDNKSLWELEELGGKKFSFLWAWSDALDGTGLHDEAPVLWSMFYPGVKIKIPNKFLTIPAIAHTKEFIRENGTIPQPRTNCQESIDILNNLRAEFDKFFIEKKTTTTATESPEAQRLWSHFIQSYSYAFARSPKVLPKVPKTGWEQVDGDARKMQWRGLSGQITVNEVIETKKEDGSIVFVHEPAHLTPVSYKLLLVLWDSHLETGEPRENKITFARICKILGMTSSKNTYNEIYRMIHDLSRQQVIFPTETGRKYYLNFLGGHGEPYKGPSGLTTIDYSIPPLPGWEKRAFKFDLRILDGLNAGQNNIVRSVVFWPPKSIPKLGGLEYHYVFRDLDKYALEMGYLPGAARGFRHIKRFIKDLKELRTKRKTNPENPAFPGFDFEIKPKKAVAVEFGLPLFENIEGGEKPVRVKDFLPNEQVIHLYHYKINPKRDGLQKPSHL